MKVQKEYINTYGSREIAQLTGASLRQLQWWDEQGLITPTQQRHARSYTEHQLAAVRLMVSLRKQGISLQKCRKILKVAPTKWQPGQRVFFITDGRRSFSGSNAEEAMRAIQSMKHKTFAVCELSA